MHAVTIEQFRPRAMAARTRPDASRRPLPYCWVLDCIPVVDDAATAACTRPPLVVPAVKYRQDSATKAPAKA